MKTSLIHLAALVAVLGTAGCASPSDSSDKPAAPAAAVAPSGFDTPPIDRHALVSRHNPVLHELDIHSPLSVGNGDFCFTVDATGLQTFPDAYNATFPLCTMADWGWHSFPNPNGWTIENYPFKYYISHGRPVPYADVAGRTKGNSTIDQRSVGANTGNAQSNFLRDNPHKFNLAQIGFVLTKADGSAAQPADISGITQTLDLWNGTLHSHFVFDSQPVDVQTVCDPVRDYAYVHESGFFTNNDYLVLIHPREVLAVGVSSPLIKLGRLAIRIHFPYASPAKNGSDWTKPAAHTTTLSSPSNTTALFQRQVDSFSYETYASWSLNGTIHQSAPHDFVITPAPASPSFAVTCTFSSQGTASEPIDDFSKIVARTQKSWSKTWSTGGAIDLSLSKDPRWFELERRIVLSQYLTIIQSAGKYPPAETGLTMNSWNGKFHMEMYWWHTAHFALWDRPQMLENSLDYYAAILPMAQATARFQGYAGARWPKMTSPSGAESPSTVGPFLIWEQPHPIYLAELDYRAHPNQDTLNQYRDVVFQTADFMASFAWWDAAAQRYVLGPPLQAAQERYTKESMFNPTYELVYWRWALTVAQQWRTRLGFQPDPKWQNVIDHLSPLPVADGKYLFTESTPDSFTNPKWVTDHPSVVNAYGVLPGPTVDPAIMRATFDWIWTNWNWPDTWGWDYPALAMCAARIGEPDRAIDALLMDTPKNHYGINGHDFQRNPDLPLYLPGNGGLLTAVAMMAAGWDGAPKHNAPGFPDNGLWTVRWEKLRPLP